MELLALDSALSQNWCSGFVALTRLTSEEDEEDDDDESLVFVSDSLSTGALARFLRSHLGFFDENLEKKNV